MAYRDLQLVTLGFRPCWCFPPVQMSMCNPFCRFEWSLGPLVGLCITLCSHRRGTWEWTTICSSLFYDLSAISRGTRCYCSPTHCTLQTLPSCILWIWELHGCYLVSIWLQPWWWILYTLTSIYQRSWSFELDILYNFECLFLRAIDNSPISFTLVGSTDS